MESSLLCRSQSGQALAPNVRKMSGQSRSPIVGGRVSAPPQHRRPLFSVELDLRSSQRFSLERNHRDPMLTKLVTRFCLHQVETLVCCGSAAAPNHVAGQRCWRNFLRTLACMTVACTASRGAHRSCNAGDAGTWRCRWLELWLDGVMCKWDRTSLMNVVTMSLPGLGGRWSNLRIPLCTNEHCWAAKHHHFDRVFVCGSRGPISFDASRWCSLEGERLGEEACKREVAGLCGAFVPGQCGLEAFEDVVQFGCCCMCRATPADTHCDVQRLMESSVLWPLERRLRVLLLTKFAGGSVDDVGLTLSCSHLMKNQKRFDYFGSIF